MSDDFFDDEQELMDEAEGAATDEKSEEAPAKKASRKGKAAEDDAPVTSGQASVRQAPPFWMVLAIAAIALILGVVIGYLLGTQATLAELGSASSSTATSTSGTQSTDSASVLPEGHPNLNINEDGTATLADSGSSAE